MRTLVKPVVLLAVLGLFCGQRAAAKTISDEPASRRHDPVNLRQKINIDMSRPLPLERFLFDVLREKYREATGKALQILIDEDRIKEAQRVDDIRDVTVLPVVFDDITIEKVLEFALPAGIDYEVRPGLLFITVQEKAQAGGAGKPPLPTGTSPRADEYRAEAERRTNAGFKLLKAGKYDEALSAYGYPGGTMGTALLHQAEVAQRDGKTKRALELYNAYFRYFPFGELYWSAHQEGWVRAAASYLSLVRGMGEDARSRRAAIDIAAMDTWDQLRLLVNDKARSSKEIQKRISELADEIVEKFPGSIFCPAAALTAASITEYYPRGNGYMMNSIRPIPIFERYLAKMQKAGAPKRSRIIVLLEYARRYVSYYGQVKAPEKGLAAYQEIIRTTDISYEKRFCLLKMAEAAIYIREDPVELRRKLYEEFIAKYPQTRYPNVNEARKARMGLLRTYYTERRFDEALAAFRKLEGTAPAGTDFSPELLKIAGWYTSAKEHKKALLLLKEATNRFPTSDFASTVYIRQGMAYGKLGDEEMMVAAYKKATEFKPSKGIGGIRPEMGVRKRSAELLAQHYMKKEQWAEAIKWWKIFGPWGWCGTGHDDTLKRKAFNIAYCKMKMGPPEKEMATIESWILEGNPVVGTEVPMRLVDFYHEQGMLDVLEEKLRQTMGNNKKGKGAGIAIEYAALIRMAEKKDVEGLWKQVGRGHPYLGMSWKTEQAINFLASIKEDAKPFVIAKTKVYGEELWACVALAKMNVDEAMPILKEKVATEGNVWCLMDYFYALTLLGTDEVYSFIEHHAKNSTGNHRTAAEKILKRYPR